MKTITLALALTLSCASCAILAKPADVIPVGEDSAVTRMVDRVVARHDMYVQDDAGILPADLELYLGESATARMLVHELEEVQVDRLSSFLNPVMDRHDLYVQTDPYIDADLDARVYLATTERLRSIIEQAERGRAE